MLRERSFWRGKSVFLTGHTGFKGGWLATWLVEMGADVHGFALAPDTQPSYFALTGLDRYIHSTIADIRDCAAILSAMRSAGPDVVFHFAAQPLVRRSYRDPVSTFDTNVIGTVNLLEAVRRISSVRAVVVVTSDKCYENGEWVWGYRESDALGGRDPYSASKACAELVCAAYRRSFFSDPDSRVALATVRAGNVIGGGDWSEDRLVPDAVRSFARGESLVVRNPRSVRPWQHVLDPLAGYLAVAMRLYCDGPAWAEAWNFGPRGDDAVSVATLVELLAREWGGGAGWRNAAPGPAPYEHGYLKLDCSKAHARLGWSPRLSLDRAIRMTVEWYRQAFAMRADAVESITREQITHYEHLLDS